MQFFAWDPCNGIINKVVVYMFLIQSLQPLYNTVHYNMVLDITQFKDGSQKCIDCIENFQYALYIFQYMYALYIFV